MISLARLTIAGAFVVSLGAAGHAQVPMTPSPTAKPQAAVISPADEATRKAKAKECSVKADAQGLHGKARKDFREKCKKG